MRPRRVEHEQERPAAERDADELAGRAVQPPAKTMIVTRIRNSTTPNSSGRVRHVARVAATRHAWGSGWQHRPRW